MDKFDEVRKLISWLEDVAKDGKYIFRGEPRYYDEISSTLRRDCLQVFNQEEDDPRFQSIFSLVQEGELATARQYTDLCGDDDILSSIQHYGGSTALIDFTLDPRVALFFACQNLLDENGRIIMILRSDSKEKDICRMWEPTTPGGRVEAQKSVLVRTKRGLITSPDEVIEIKSADKILALNCLKIDHDISDLTIFGDLHGYIRAQNLRKKESLKLAVSFHRGVDALLLGTFVVVPIGK